MRGNCAQIVTLGLLLGLLFLLLAVQSYAEPVPPLLPITPAVERLPRVQTGPSQERAFTHQPQSIPCDAGDCSSAIPVSCNTVVQHWANDRVDRQWITYSCLDTDIFADLPYSETLYAISIVTNSLDVSLAIPQTVTGMNVFGGVLTGCNSDDCQAATHNKGATIYQHAVIPDAPTQDYTFVIDSDNMSGYGDAIIACGRHDTGWCEDAISTTQLACGDYTIHDNTDYGLDNITFYGSNLAYDGPEMTYKLVLTDTRFLSPTLFYSGNESMPYHSYLAYFLLDYTCNQRQVYMYSGLAGETGDRASSYARWLPAGTYYLVVDGLHMPSGGDAFRLDMLCSALEVDKEGKDLNGELLYPGDIIEYTVRLHNRGGAVLPDLNLTDYIPVGTTYIADSAQATPTATIGGPDPLTATWGTLAANQTASLTFRVTVDATAIGKTIVNTAKVSSPDAAILGQDAESLGPVRDPNEIDFFRYLPIALREH
jgi:uncharacterized repeat protein (TIGR01451 family)